MLDYSLAAVGYAAKIEGKIEDKTFKILIDLFSCYKKMLTL